MPLTITTITDLRSPLAAIVEPETRRASADGWALRAMAQARAAEAEVATVRAELAQTRTELATARAFIATELEPLCARNSELQARLSAADAWIAQALAFVGVDNRNVGLGLLLSHCERHRLAQETVEPEDNVIPINQH